MWLYEFSWASTARGGDFGACHFVEVPFSFDLIDNEQARGIAGEPPQSLADIVHGAWVSFVKRGDPNGGALPHWPKYNLDARPTMFFDLPSRVVDDPAADERELWTGII